MSGPPLPVRPPAAGASLYRCRCVVVSLLINAKSMLIEAIRCRSLLIETCVWAPLPMRRCIAANQFQVNANRCNSLQICYSMLLNAIQCCSLPIRLINANQCYSMLFAANSLCPCLAVGCSQLVSELVGVTSLLININQC